MIQFKYSLLLPIVLISGLAYAQSPENATAKPKYPPILTVIPKATDARLDVGINAGYVSNGYKADNTVSVLPYGFFDNNRFYIEGGEAGAYIYKDDSHQARIGLSYDGRSFDPKEADELALKQLDKRKAQVVAQANYMAITPIGGIRAKVAKNIFGGDNDGTAFTLSHVSRFEYGKTTFYPSFGATWHDKKYNRYYYGISAEESQKSGLTQYSPNDSISPFVSLTVMYDLSQKWGIMGNQRIEWLGDSQKNSPMSDNDIQSTTRIGLHYKFD